jgi:hypothetical protein
MPETPMNKDGRHSAAEHHIGAPRQRAVMQAIAVAKGMREPPNDHFRFRVFAADKRHSLATLGWCQCIHRVKV